MNADSNSPLYTSLYHKLLSPAQEKSLIARAQSGDESAAEQLIRANQRLVYKLARAYYRSGITGDLALEDLVQEGNIGLLIAMRKFDLGRNLRFTTYAYPWIKSASAARG